MRHDEERPRTSGFLADGTVPGHWTQVLGSMRANPFTHLSPDEVRTEAAGQLIVAPSPEVAWACFGELLASVDPGARPGPRITITAPDDLVASDVPAGMWVYLPHRQDGWTDLEDASAKLRATLVKENSTREAGSKLVLMEYGINLWMWAEPPSSGGDPVCHAGELISWESAWALGAGGAADAGSAGGSTSASGDDAVATSAHAADSLHAADSVPGASARPPIYFGLPPILRKRRWES
ncbi:MULTISPECIES: hypothetical protein [unclassified Brevibacterium]|uniref:hypothetical protein n=1 Tax=unclassified Brevibacterium TaxID=2614124 RepID=UPI001436B861|nr:hypothetical protein [Brevibacterium sp. S111]